MYFMYINMYIILYIYIYVYICIFIYLSYMYVCMALYVYIVLYMFHCSHEMSRPTTTLRHRKRVNGWAGCGYDCCVQHINAISRNCGRQQKMGGDCRRTHSYIYMCVHMYECMYMQVRADIGQMNVVIEGMQKIKINNSYTHIQIRVYIFMSMYISMKRYGYMHMCIY